MEKKKKGENTLPEVSNDTQNASTSQSFQIKMELARTSDDKLTRSYSNTEK